MRTGTLPEVRRLPKPAGPARAQDGRFDYADSFEVRLTRPDDTSAEQWARNSLELAPTWLRRLVVFAHRVLLRFELGPVSDPQHVLGWRIRRADTDTIELEAAGSLMSAVLVGSRTAPDAARLDTFLYYRGRLGGVVWAVVGPIHRRVAPYLLKRGVGPG
jgi:hypothetical protein